MLDIIDPLIYDRCLVDLLLASEALGGCDTKPTCLLITKRFYIQREARFSTSVQNPGGLLRQGRRQTDRQTER